MSNNLVFLFDTGFKDRDFVGRNVFFVTGFKDGDFVGSVVFLGTGWLDGDDVILERVFLGGKFVSVTSSFSSFKNVLKDFLTFLPCFFDEDFLDRFFKDFVDKQVGYGLGENEPRLPSNIDRL